MALNLVDLDGTNGFRLDGVSAYGYSGRSVSIAGDVNGDGFDDLIVGAPSAVVDGIYSGGSYVVFGAGADFAASLDLATLDGTNGFGLGGVNGFDSIGYSVAGAGDFNGDGLDDLIVGAFGVDAAGYNSGASYVVFGSTSSFAPILNLESLGGVDGFRLSGISAGDRSGSSVASAGDVNGDGFDDLIIGAPGASRDGRIGAGESYVVFGHSTGFDPSLDLATLDGSNGFRLEGASSYDQSGFSVAGAGDVNGDEIADLIVGAPGVVVDGKAFAGASFVVFGSSTAFAAGLSLDDIDGTNGFRLDGIAAGDQSGWSVAGAGDVNGDGIGDLIIGSLGADPGGKSYAGESYVVFGSSEAFDPILNLAALDGTNGFRVDGEFAYDQSGVSVAGAGDFNGDGTDDLLIGASGADPGGTDMAGETFVVFGSTTGFAPVLDIATFDDTNSFQIDGINALDQIGLSVSGGGDVNDDGFDDLILGGQFADPYGRENAGSSYVVFGRADKPDDVVNLSETVSFDGEQAGKGIFDTTQGAKDSLSIGRGHRTALVFEDVAVPEGAEIESATLTLTAQGSNGPTTTIQIRLNGDPDGIAASGRAVLTDPGFDTFDFVPFAAGGWEDGETIVTPDLAALVQEFVDGGPGSDGDFDLAFSLWATKGKHLLQPEELGADVAAVLDISYILPDFA